MCRGIYHFVKSLPQTSQFQEEDSTPGATSASLQGQYLLGHISADNTGFSVKQQSKLFLGSFFMSMTLSILPVLSSFACFPLSIFTNQ